MCLQTHSPHHYALARGKSSWIRHAVHTAVSLWNHPGKPLVSQRTLAGTLGWEWRPLRAAVLGSLNRKSWKYCSASYLPHLIAHWLSFRFSWFDFLLPAFLSHAVSRESPFSSSRSVSTSSFFSALSFVSPLYEQIREYFEFHLNTLQFYASSNNKYKVEKTHPLPQLTQLSPVTSWWGQGVC